jgi:hypothetical protein
MVSSKSLAGHQHLEELCLCLEYDVGYIQKDWGAIQVQTLVAALTESKKFDLQNNLLGTDLKMVTVQAQGEDVETIRIKLKQPKTSKSQLTQIVVLLATGGWLCPRDLLGC